MVLRNAYGYSLYNTISFFFLKWGSSFPTTWPSRRRKDLRNTELHKQY